MNTKDFDWEKSFDIEYGNDVNIWTLGIVAEGLAHGRKYPLGEDASYITRKLREKVHKAIQADRQQLLKAVEGIDFYSIATHPDLIGKRWVDLDGVIELLKESDSDKAKDNMEGEL